MLKKTLLFALLTILSFGASAQDKIAYFNSAEIIMALPDYSAMQDSLQTIRKDIEAELNKMQEDYEKKYLAFIEEGEQLSESIRNRRMGELQDLETRAREFQQKEEQKMQATYQSLMQALQEKVIDAVKKVGEESNYMYILDITTGAVPFVNEAAPNATNQIKAKLGLQ